MVQLELANVVSASATVIVWCSRSVDWTGAAMTMTAVRTVTTFAIWPMCWTAGSGLVVAVVVPGVVENRAQDRMKNQCDRCIVRRAAHSPD